MAEVKDIRHARPLSPEEDEALVAAGVISPKEDVLRAIAAGEGRPASELLAEVLTEEEEDRQLAEWFAKMSAPDDSPVVEEPEFVPSDSFPYRRTVPRKALWHGASTMSRVPLR